MALVISDSDSEISIQSTTAAKKSNTLSDSDRDSEFNFPSVGFHYEVDKSKKDKCEIHKIQDDESEIDKHEDIPKTTNLRSKRKNNNVDVPQAQKKTKTIKRGDGLKTIKVCLDDALIENDFSCSITDALKSFDIPWSFQKLPIAKSIKWITTNESNEPVTQKHILIIWNWDEAVTRVKNKTLENDLKKLLNSSSDQKPMLVLCGMEEYFENKSRVKQNTKRPKNKESMSFDDAPKITRHELEICLTKIQQNLKCSCQMLDIPEALGPFVYRFTKSIAEIPFKEQQRMKIEQNLDWYAQGYNRNTVKVDNDGNGLSRLWQQQLCQFTMATLETAEAISSIYPSPLQLIAAYQECTKDEGEKLLKDLPIRRAAGPLTTIRKLGPVLSKKIFKMFTFKDGEASLGN